MNESEALPSRHWETAQAATDRQGQALWPKGTRGGLLESLAGSDTKAPFGIKTPPSLFRIFLTINWVSPMFSLWESKPQGEPIKQRVKEARASKSRFVMDWIGVQTLPHIERWQTSGWS